MDKQQSQMLKGVAILLMIFLHLFNKPSNVDLCHHLIYVDGSPLVLILSLAANPVPFYLILGGYGLYKVYEKGDRHRYGRLLKLMIHYWIIIAIFLTVGHFISPERYPGSFSILLKNVACYETTYNYEMWFLLPYVVLSLLSPWLFRVASRFSVVSVIAVALLIHIASGICISRYHDVFLIHYPLLVNLMKVLFLLFNFMLGALAARERLFEKIGRVANGYRYAGVLSWSVMICLVVINCIFKYNFFYSFLVLLCLTITPMPGVVKVCLSKLGGQSMNMWMIHTWFCYYLFHNFIYSFTFPLLIFTVLTVISYYCSKVVNVLAFPIERWFMSRAEIKAKPIL